MSHGNSLIVTILSGSVVIYMCVCTSLQTAEYIETKLGCCYETFIQHATAIEFPKELIYSSDFFTKCYGKAIQPACSRK